MDEFRALLDRFWVTRAENKELYFTLKRILPEYRRLINEQLGWNLIVNEAMVKLEKVPPRALPWMGIQSFQTPMDYCLLCAVLLFLADLDDGAPFLLSSLTRAAETFLAEVRPVDWTQFLHRKSLVRVLQYAQEIGLVLVYDGDSAGFGGNRDQEVLYENTGLSRHFPVHFDQDIMECRSIEDFEAFAWEGEETESRRHRIYRQLALTPGLYCSTKAEATMTTSRINARQSMPAWTKPWTANSRSIKTERFSSYPRGIAAELSIPARGRCLMRRCCCVPSSGRKLNRATIFAGRMIRCCCLVGNSGMRWSGAVPGGETAGVPRYGPCLWSG